MLTEQGKNMNAFKVEESEIEYKKYFSYYCNEWLKTKFNNISESTYSKYYGVVKKYIEPRLGKYLIQSLSADVTNQFSQELLQAEKLSEKTVKDILEILNSIMKYTAKQVPEQLPMFELVYPKVEGKEMRVLTKGEQTRFVRHLLTEMDACTFGILLCLFTGMKIGEICALRWEDISLEEGVIKVTSTMQRVRDFDDDSTRRTKIVITNLKENGGSREIPMSDRVLNLCMKYRRQEPDAFVLTGVSGVYMEPRTLQYRFDKYAEECGLKNVRFNDLRHTFATRCVEVDFEIKSLSEILGYSGMHTLVERYATSSMKRKRNDMNKLADLGF